MYGEKALELIKELQRARSGTLPPYNEDLVRQVIEEIKALYEQNQKEIANARGSEHEVYPSIQMRHAALERNKRCLLAYLYNRLKNVGKMRWDFGSVLPPEVKYSLSEQEVLWFNNYNKMLATYMRSIGSHGGLDLTQDIKPPTTLYIEVRCLTDQGEFETQDGNVILLKKNTQHFLLRSECEHMIRQGVLEHIVN